ncbi:hypothetical protein QCN29_06720 [Streptomyces sp. HNM0663]|uniref:Uncharacterized protein n=1 Tax=Streptomyces chengmaiensis TaxID=3040919 RepID=A0ABT6HI94_9ACTN|nr:hypothetical protein [Streptomyces chengmaiensis]
MLFWRMFLSNALMLLVATALLIGRKLRNKIPTACSELLAALGWPRGGRPPHRSHGQSDARSMRRRRRP